VVVDQILAAMGFPLPSELDLLLLIQIGKDHGILNRREANILSDINNEANGAKHIVNF
jgi:hypothetical protein